MVNPTSPASGVRAMNAKAINCVAGRNEVPKQAQIVETWQRYYEAHGYGLWGFSPSPAARILAARFCAVILAGLSALKSSTGDVDMDEILSTSSNLASMSSGLTYRTKLSPSRVLPIRGAKRPVSHFLEAPVSMSAISTAFSRAGPGRKFGPFLQQSSTPAESCRFLQHHLPVDCMP